ncbi:Mur ligase domain-containing protein [Mucilaginibacter sp. 5C4]|uniref:Mur ligase domain-containing protein n=1 Tax=Mucilaginibacter sp. 5C4 TaxID=3048589 RepID=UPI002AC8A61C|nr:Mur ligase domain-containing protein [Mucilaginibacter sp. 5C4]WPX23908.1 Mur ligase domain-containing protein [Mucilaginibacter sp. 5C4]
MKTTTEQLYQLFIQHPVISTDTRKIAPGSLFFALKGDKFDANTFAAQAVEAGAAYAVIDNPEFATGERFFWLMMCLPHCRSWQSITVSN